MGDAVVRVSPGTGVPSFESSPDAIPTLIERAERGEPGVTEALFEALYAELHRLSKRQLARHSGAITLGATTLLHEAYLDIAARSANAYPDAARFMGYAARVMRGLIIDYARSHHAQKRGGRFEITSLAAAHEHAIDERELMDISDALDELSSIDRSLAEIVDLRFFCGFSFAEIASTQGISERTAQRRWEKARIYLHRTIRTRSIR